MGHVLTRSGRRRRRDQTIHWRLVLQRWPSLDQREKWVCSPLGPPDPGLQGLQATIHIDGPYLHWLLL